MLHLFLKKRLKDNTSIAHWIMRGLIWAASTYLLLLGLRYAEDKTIDKMTTIIGIGAWIIGGVAWGIIMRYIYIKLKKRDEQKRLPIR